MIKSNIKKYKVSLILLIVNIIVLIISPQIGKESFKTVGGSLVDLISVVPPIFILLGLLDVWVEKETMVKFMGEGSGLKGIIISFLLGSVAAGPLYASFPVAQVFIGKGAKFSNILIFIGAWSTTKIPLMLFEASSLGARFTIIRFLLNLPVILIIAFGVEKLMKKEEIDKIYKFSQTE